MRYLLHKVEDVTPEPYAIIDGYCFGCLSSSNPHRVIYVTSGAEPDFDALGLVECMWESGEAANGETWERYICRLKPKPPEPETISREDFEELYAPEEKT